MTGWGVNSKLEICWAKQVAKLGGVSTFFGKAVNDSLASLSRLSHTWLFDSHQWKKLAMPFPIRFMPYGILHFVNTDCKF
jgi:hypothetical protein